MNAVSVYVNTAKLVLQSTESSAATNICSNNELPRQLLSLRQLLSCVVCCRLATDPYSPNHGRCSHNVCRLCIRGPKSLHPSCQHCRDTRDFKTYDENKQLRCLLVCYRSLCEHLRCSAIFPLLAGRKVMQYSSMSPALNMPQMSLQDLIVEGASYDDILSTFSKDLPKPLIFGPPSKQQPTQMPALVTPLSSSTSAATPLAPIQQNIKSAGISQAAARIATPPTSLVTAPITSVPSSHASHPKVETSIALFSGKQQQQQSITVSSVHTPTPSPHQTTTHSGYSHPQLIQLNQLKNTGNITYIGPNARGIVVPIVSSSVTTTVPLSIASARLQTLNRQLAQARALQVVSSAGTSCTTNPTFASSSSSSSIETRPQLTAYKVSLASTQPPKVVHTINSLSSFSTSSSASSLTPCITTMAGNPITTATITSQLRNPPPIKTVSNGSAMYSVLYTGIGNKITIKRKTDADEDYTQRKNASTSSAAPNTAQLRPLSKMNNKKRGCRCGNTTATPGKLTCCGQRCPCYVDSKSCIGCKCRGCRNPHRPDGNKVRPVIPELACYEIQMADDHANINELPIATSSGGLNTYNGNGALTTMPQTSMNIKQSGGIVTSSEGSAATLVPIRGLQQTPRSSPLPTLTSASLPLATVVSMTQTSSLGGNTAPLSTTTPVSVAAATPTQGSIVQLDQMQRESLLIQNAEGKFQVVNLFTTNTTQTGSQVSSLQRIQNLPQTMVSMSGSNNFILPTSISTTSHSGTSTTTTLPQFILQSQQQQHHHHHHHQQTQAHLIHQHKQHQHSQSTQRICSSAIATTTLPLQLQQQLKQNIITVHTIGSNTAANTSPATASVLTPSSSPAPTTATLSLAPLIINSAQSQSRTCTAELLEDCEDVHQHQRYTNIVVSSSSSSGTTSVVRDVLTTPITMTLASASHAHHKATINLKALDSSNV